VAVGPVGGRRFAVWRLAAGGASVPVPGATGHWRLVAAGWWLVVALQLAVVLQPTPNQTSHKHQPKTAPF
jgi:hypothetical protein